MKREHLPASVFILVSAISLAVGATGGQNIAFWLVLAGMTLVLWVVALWRRWSLMATTALILTVALSAAGVSSRHGPLWMVASLTSGLSAWVMLLALNRLGRVVRVDGQPAMLRRTLVRLLIIDGLALVLVTVALNLRLSLRFFPALSIGLLLVFLLTRLIGATRPQVE